MPYRKTPKDKEFLDYVWEYKHFIVPIGFLVGATYAGYFPIGVAFCGWYIVIRNCYLLIVVTYGDIETFFETIWKNIVDFWTTW